MKNWMRSTCVRSCRNSCPNDQAAQLPDMDLGRKFITDRVLGQNVEDRVIPLPPSFELIPRAERLRRKNIRCHYPPKGLSPSRR
jgi:hypothetical protein